MHGTFANARMEFGDWLIFSYIALVVSLPIRLIQTYVYEDPNVQMLRFMEQFNNPALEPFLAGLRQNVSTAELPIAKFMKVIALIGGVAIAPIIVIWFGYGMTSKVVITATIAFFPVLANTIVGLRAVARALDRSAMRPTDIVGRYGGEEFVVLLPETELARALQIAERIRTSIALASHAIGDDSILVVFGNH